MPEPTDEQTPDREVFRFLGWAWDVTKARRLIDDGVGTRVELPVADWARLVGLIAVDPDHAATVNLDQPVVLVDIADTGGLMVGPFVIDGWHRIYRAHREGRSHLPAYLLDPAAEARVRLQTKIRLVEA
jgi:hypothetical protein